MSHICCCPFAPPPFLFCLQELNDRDRFLQVLLEKYQQASEAQAGAAAAASDQQQQQAGAPLQAAGTGGGSGSSKQVHGLPVNAVSSGAPLLLDEAVAVVIRNERGRQVSMGNG